MKLPTLMIYTTLVLIYGVYFVEVKGQCDRNDFRCDNGRCIFQLWTCDNEDDCGDNSDEINCHKCNPKTQFECKDGKCIDLNKVCDGRKECNDWDDEFQCYVHECAANNGGCDHVCHELTDDYRCSCQLGYNLEVDNHTCVDINECEKYPPPCSQACNNYHGTYVCKCADGFILESDGNTCKATGPDPLLIFTNRFDIQQHNINTHETLRLFDNLRGAIGLDFHDDYQRLYWTDVIDNQILSGKINDSYSGNPEIDSIGRSSHFAGVAVDWIHDNLYWTDQQRNTIGVANLDGSKYRVLINNEVDEPRAIVVEPESGYIFWTDWSSIARIEKAGMNGKDRSRIVTTDIKWPNGLAIDYYSELLFWVDAGLDTLSNCNFDGHKRRTIIDSKTILQHPFSIAVFGNEVYWNDWEIGSILKANKFDGTSVKEVLTSLGQTFGLRAMHPLIQYNVTENLCGQNNGRCSYLCVGAPKFHDTSSGYSCLCPEGQEIMENGHTCNETSMSDECNPDYQFQCRNGTCIDSSSVCDGQVDCEEWEDELNCNVDECATNNGECDHLCHDIIDGYFCSCQADYKLDIDNHTCIVINDCEKSPPPCSQSCNYYGKFKCSCADGFNLEPDGKTCRATGSTPLILFSTRYDIREFDPVTTETRQLFGGLKSAIGVDFHIANQQVYWTDVFSDQILRGQLDDSITGIPEVILEGVNSSSSIAVDWVHDTIYWTDEQSNLIGVSNLDGSKHRVLIDNDVDAPRSIVVEPESGYIFWTDWSSNARIEKAGMDGENRGRIVTTDIRWPNGLAIDYYSELLFWVDARLDTLSSCNFDGHKRRTIIDSVGILRHPFSIAVFENEVLWTDWATDSIQKANKLDGSSRTTLLTGLIGIMNLKVMHPLIQYNTSENYCAQNDGGCSYLCVGAPKLPTKSSRYSCLCSDGQNLMEESLTCIDQ